MKKYILSLIFCLSLNASDNDDNNGKEKIKNTVLMKRNDSDDLSQGVICPCCTPSCLALCILYSCWYCGFDTSSIVGYAYE